MKRLFFHLQSYALMAFLMVVVAMPDGKQDSGRLLASHQIYNAAFNDVSPGFDDLYMIRTQDKGREIVIYCNAAYCYKNRNAIMTS